MQQPLRFVGFCGSLAWTVLMLTPAAARAQADNFDSGSDAAWTHHDLLTFADVGASYTFPNGHYRIQIGPTPQPQATGPSRAASLRLDRVFDRFTAAVDVVAWDNTHDQAIGLLGRADHPGLGTLNGYAFTYATGGHEIDLTRVDGERPTNLAKAFVTLDPTSSYRLAFSGDGTSLEGEVFRLSGGAVAGPPVASVAAADDRYAFGSAGLVVFDNTDTRFGSKGADATFDNFDASVPGVPEPAGLPLLAAAAACLLRRRGRVTGRAG